MRRAIAKRAKSEGGMERHESGVFSGPLSLWERAGVRALRTTGMQREIGGALTLPSPKGRGFQTGVRRSLVNSPLLAPLIAMFALGLASPAFAQSSSLYTERPQPPAAAASSQITRDPNATGERLSPAIARASLTAVRAPEPKQFAVQDLVTIIVRESTENDSESSLDTTKDSGYDGEVSDFPQIRLFQQLTDIPLKTGLQDNPKLGVKFKSDFKGDGQYSRKDTFTSRITARILDVKPNGTLVLEARKYIKSDEETLTMVLTGTCRREDIKADNTVLSTQMYDLNLNKEHSGALHRAGKKGVLTKLLDKLFAF